METNKQIIEQLLNAHHLELDELITARALLKSLSKDVEKRLLLYGKKHIVKVDFWSKEYRDKTNANSYFSCRIYVIYGDGTSDTYYIPYTYGYERQYEYEAFSLLIKNGVIKNNDNCLKPNYYFSTNDIKFISEKYQNCSKSEVMNWGQSDEQTTNNK